MHMLTLLNTARETDTVIAFADAKLHLHQVNHWFYSAGT